MEPDNLEGLREEIRGVNYRMGIFRGEALAELRASRGAAEFCRTFLIVAAVLLVIFLFLKPDPTRAGETVGWIFSWLIWALWKLALAFVWIAPFLLAWVLGKELWDEYRSRHSQPQGKAAAPPNSAERV
jgi:hypothetical protein